MSSIFDIIRIPIAWILRMCYKLVPNYMVALLLFALIMQILLLPFAIKQQKNSIKQASLAPKLAAIRKKYAGRTDKVTQQKMQQEQMDLYQRENYNMMGGCLPLLIQMPILFALFRVITQPLRYLCGMPQTDVDTLVSAFKDTGAAVSAYPQIDLVSYLKSIGAEASAQFASGIESFSFEKLPNFSIFGGKIDLAIAPQAAVAENGLFTWMMLIPVITVAALLFSQFITKKFTYQAPETQDAQSNCSMKLMLYAMPLLSGYFAYLYAAAIGIYWIFRNLLSLLQQIILAKVMPIPKFTEEDYKAAEKEILRSNRVKKGSRSGGDPSKPKARSLHYIDADDDEEYVDNGKVTKYDEDDDTDGDGEKGSDPENRLKGVAPSAIEAPIKDDKGKKYKKKK